MTGTELKKLLYKTGLQQKEIAALLGMSQANFAAVFTVKDIKTGLIEQLCKVLDLDLHFFYSNTEFLKPQQIIMTQEPKETITHLQESERKEYLAIISNLQKQNQQLTDIIDRLSSG